MGRAPHYAHDGEASTSIAPPPLTPSLDVPSTLTAPPASAPTTNSKQASPF